MSVGAPVRTQGPVVVGTIADRSVPGRRAFSFPALDVPEVAVPAAHARAVAPALPRWRRSTWSAITRGSHR